ncbi:hypothetical protein REJC140_03742 [Pseudorhizobium endolithicum]|uniref:C4-dicarboxylate ABC transporter permease n=1 Tax=Pseudorhizobium endolithicum TaxID=1191678 RepID=A0ABM8PR12_9HYPH|nr:hypothetical protein [Pseudorhizobium endolithicum]CAD7043825.1 hypothetical protein REJC140_03742 [Pseudorhizobium endolithicum]
MTRPWHLLALALAGAAALIGLDIWTQGFGSGLVRETGGIEMASALLYAYAAITWLWTRPGDSWKTSWELPAIMFLMMGRELDLDKKLTSIGVLRSDLYLTDMAPIMERIFGVIALVFVAIVAFRVIASNGRAFIDGLQRWKAWAWALVVGIGFAVLSKSVDGIGRKLAPFGITLEQHTSLLMVILEELLELGVPVMFIVAVIASIRLADPTSNPRK